MRAKSRASQIAKAMIFVAVLVSSTAVSPNTYQALGAASSTNSTSVGSTITPNASISSYHDI
jgi:hypothetical protein